jgi:hypothetical protein
MLILFQQSYAGNNLNRMLAGHDSDLKACGVDYALYPYVYFPTVPSNTAAWLASRICVKACPGASSSTVDFMPTVAFPSGAS